MRTIRTLLRRVTGPVRVRFHLYAMRKVWESMSKQAADVERNPLHGSCSPAKAWRQVHSVERGIRRIKRLIAN